MKLQFKKICFKKICVSFLGLALLSGCAGDGGIKKQGMGTAIGAVAGGLLGSRFGKGEGQLLAAGVGAIAGGFIGSSIGKSMDEQDKRMMTHSSNQALEYTPAGNSVEWRNPDSGHHGSVTPTRTYKNTRGDYCREYTQTVTIGGHQEKAYGRACRQPDGQWQIEQ